MSNTAEPAYIRQRHCRDGIHYPNIVLDSSIDRMRKFEVRSDDIWTVTYPKSGTHWMIEIVGLILNDGFPEKMDRSLYGACAEMIDVSQDLPNSREEEDKNPVDMSPFLDVIEKAPSPRSIHTHLRLGCLPKDMLTKAKVIYVARNPKDVAHSWYQFVGGDQGAVTWETSLENFMTGRNPFGPWFEHVREFWEVKSKGNILFLFYEEISKDPVKYIQRIAEHLGRPLSDEALQRVLEHSRLDSMKTAYKKLAAEQEGLKNLVKRDGGQESAFLNKGIRGKWKQRFTVAQNEAFDEWNNDKMAATDLKFTFE